MFANEALAEIMDMKKVTEVSDEVLQAIQSIHQVSSVQPDIKDGDIFLLAKDGSAILGYAHARPSISHLLALYVQPNQRKGKRKVGV